MTEDKVYYVSNDHLMRIIGPADKYFNIIRNFFNVSLKIRENELSISGDESDVEAALKIINEMLKMTELNEDIDEQKVLYLVDIIKDDCSDYSIMLKDTIITTFVTVVPIKNSYARNAPYMIPRYFILSGTMNIRRTISSGKVAA